MNSYITFSNIKAKFKVPKVIKSVVEMYSWRYTGKNIITDIFKGTKRTSVTLNKFLKDMGTKYRVKLSENNKTRLNKAARRN